MHSSLPSCGCYLTKTLKYQGLNLACTKLLAKLAKYQNRFGAIAFRGTSGAIVAPCLALVLKKNLIVVRKYKGHSCAQVEGVLQPYIIVDDFISTGRTIKIIVDRIERESENGDINCKCIGVCLYSETNEVEARKKIHKILPNISFCIIVDNS